MAVPSPLLLLAALAPALALASPRAAVSVFRGLGCRGDPSDRLSLDVLADPFAAYCHDEERSFLLPPNASVAVYQECHRLEQFSGANPRFVQLVTSSDRVGSCVNLPQTTGQDYTFTIQLVESMRDVCEAYAAHIGQRCDPNECSEECWDALEAAKSMTPQCQGLDVSRVAAAHGLDTAVHSPSEVEETDDEEAHPHGGRDHRRGHHGGPQDDTTSTSESEESHSEDSTEEEDRRRYRHHARNHAMKQRRHKLRHAAKRARKLLRQKQNADQSADQNADQSADQNGQPDSPDNNPTPGSSNRGNRIARPNYFDYVRFVDTVEDSFVEVCEDELMRVGYFVFMTASVAAITCSTCLLCKRCRRRSRAMQVREVTSTNAIPVMMTSPGQVDAVILTRMTPATAVSPSRVQPNSQKQIESDYAMALRLAQQP